jgi:spore coat polysaccharide biosynthesis protein SpsF (cytidylyltransferase family)
MSSTRLPGKALLDIGGHSMLWHVVQAAPKPRCIAMPNESHSIDIVKAFANTDVELYLPPERIPCADVLGRYACCVEDYFPRATHVLRLTGDCPALRAEDVETFLHMCFPYGDTTIHTNRPWDQDGYDMELFSVPMLMWTNAHAKLAQDREHVCSMMYRVFNVHRLSVWEHHPGEMPGKHSVDTIDEYNFVKHMMEGRR